jgi:hypothetical protein
VGGKGGKVNWVMLTGATCELIDEVPADETADEAYYGCDRDGGRWLAEGDAADKYDGFDT